MQRSENMQIGVWSKLTGQRFEYFICGDSRSFDDQNILLILWTSAFMLHLPTFLSTTSLQSDSFSSGSIMPESYLARAERMLAKSRALATVENSRERRSKALLRVCSLFASCEVRPERTQLCMGDGAPRRRHAKLCEKRERSKARCGSKTDGAFGRISFGTNISDSRGWVTHVSLFSISNIVLQQTYSCRSFEL